MDADVTTGDGVDVTAERPRRRRYRRGAPIQPALGVLEGVQDSPIGELAEGLRGGGPDVAHVKHEGQSAGTGGSGGGQRSRERRRAGKQDVGPAGRPR